MCIIGWIITGALAGWIATLISRRDGRMGWLENVIVGIAGAIVGGWIWSWSTHGPILMSMTIGAVLNAVLGALLLLLIWGLAAGRSSARSNR